MEARELMLRLPPPEDANAIQVGIMRIQKSLIEDTISMKKAGLLLYSMQLATDERGPDDIWASEGRRDGARDGERGRGIQRKPKAFTAKDTEDTKEN